MKESANLILIVDDHAINRKLAGLILQTAGYRVLEAERAEQALAIIRQTPPDLILMDVALPGMDGLSLTRQLKADDTTRGIKIVVFTAFAMKTDEEAAKSAGCDGYITKPIDTRKFPGQVADLLAAPANTPETQK